VLINVIEAKAIYDISLTKSFSRNEIKEIKEVFDQIIHNSSFMIYYL